MLTLIPSLDDPTIQVIARLPSNLLPHSLPSLDNNDPKTIVALRQGLHFLTTFHPELTNDDRFHDYFVRECVLNAADQSHMAPLQVQANNNLSNVDS